MEIGLLAKNNSVVEKGDESVKFRCGASMAEHYMEKRESAHLFC